MSEEITIKVKRELFSFHSEQDWINKAQSRYANCGVPNGYYVTIDAFGRVMHRGQCFKAATKQNAYPVTVYELATNWNRKAPRCDVLESIGLPNLRTSGRARGSESAVCRPPVPPGRNFSGDEARQPVAD
jgi:hypothetical protein